MSDLSPAGSEIFPATHARQSLIESLLHAMGQPLSALQVCALLHDRVPSAPPPPDLLQDVAGQVTTLTRLFCSLRELLGHTGPASPLPSMEVLQFAAAALPRWRHTAHTRHLHLHAELGFPGESGRSGHASLPWQHTLSELVEAAFLSAAPTGSVTLRSYLCGAAPTLSLQGGPLLSESSHAARFTLPIAALLLQAPGQSFTYSLRPFAATLSLGPLSSLQHLAMQAAEQPKGTA